jgi:putative ABC transport system ATP-binding protein
MRPGRATEHPIIRARGIGVTIAGTDILHGVDLQVDRGESVAVMGPSGSGKSTLLYAVSGMDTVSVGAVDFDGEELTSLSQARLGRLRLGTMGFVFQQPQLLTDLTLLDNVVLPGFTARMRPRRDVVARARDLMRRAGVGDLADRDVTQASGGQLQRVGICRALINDPTVVFADEPTGALDSNATADVLRLLHSINADGTTLVTVTHDPGVAAHAGRVLAMRDGTVEAELVLGAVNIDDTDALATRRERVTAWLAMETSSDPSSAGGHSPAP